MLSPPSSLREEAVAALRLQEKRQRPHFFPSVPARSSGGRALVPSVPERSSGSRAPSSLSLREAAVAALSSR